MKTFEKDELIEYKKTLSKIGDNKKANQYIFDHLRKYVAGYTWNIYNSNALEFNSEVMDYLKYDKTFMLESDTIALLVTLMEKIFNEIDEIKKKEEVKNCQVVKLPKDALVRHEETDTEFIFYYKKGVDNDKNKKF